MKFQSDGHVGIHYFPFVKFDGSKKSHMDTHTHNDNIFVCQIYGRTACGVLDGERLPGPALHHTMTNRLPVRFLRLRKLYNPEKRVINGRRNQYILTLLIDGGKLK